MANDDKHSEADHELTDTAETGDPGTAVELGGEVVEPDAAADEPSTADMPDAPPPRTSRGPRLLATFALLVALASALLAGFLWWQYRQFYVALNAADNSGQAGLRQARTEIVALEDQLADLSQGDRNLRTQIEAVRDDVARVPPRLVDFEERLQSLQGVSENSRRAWLRAEVEYLLSLANMELALASRWDTARQALTLADAKLKELANPSLVPVRSAIADTLQRLNAVPLADHEGLNLALGNLAGRVDEMPLKASADRSKFESGPVSIDKPPGFERAWASFKAALAGLVRIEKRDVPVRRALTLREEALLRLSLELEIEAARLSLLRADGAGFRTSLVAAQQTLNNDFDAGDGGVQAALDTLAGMAEVTIDPVRPDISEPLMLMRRLTTSTPQQPLNSDANDVAPAPVEALPPVVNDGPRDAEPAVESAP